MNTDLIAICIAFGLFCVAVLHDLVKQIKRQDDEKKTPRK